MLFSNTNDKPASDLKIGGTLIEQTTEARFLGVIIDEKVNWSSLNHYKTQLTDMLLKQQN